MIEQRQQYQVMFDVNASSLILSGSAWEIVSALLKTVVMFLTNLGISNLLIFSAILSVNVIYDTFRVIFS